MSQHVIGNNHLMVFFLLFVLHVNEVMKTSYANTWIFGSNLEKAKFLVAL
jgi:hypothetical protein